MADGSQGEGGQAPSLRELNRGVHELLEEGSGRKLVLPVVVQGGGIPTAREARLRYRYAVVSALGVAGYVPEDGERIGYFFADATVLKTIVRSNPGVWLIKDGTVIEKWHYNDTPLSDEVADLVK